MVFKEVALGELCDFKYGKVIKNRDLLDYSKDLYPVFSGYGIVGYHTEYLFEEPQVIVVSRGVGGCGDVKMTPPKCFLTNLSIAVIPKKEVELDKRFLYWSLLYSDTYSLISGSAQPQITINDLKEHKICYTTLKIQRKISSILDSIQNKIELNRRMNETLEQMAMAVYKHWFVDFGPFQDGEFEESELGPIPKGWTIKKLSTLVETQYGYTESASTEKVGPHFLRGTDINKTTHIDWTTVPYCKISQEDYEKYKLLP